MRGSIVVLALAVAPFVARVSNAQGRSHAVRHETPIAQQDDRSRGKSDEKKCEDRKRGNPSDNGLQHRADPRTKGNKDCDPPQDPPPPPAPAPDPAPAPSPDPTPVPTLGHTSVYGNVFFDLDHDNVMGPDEVGLSGWTVQITGPVTLTTVTDGNGAYSFTGLDAGTYLVCVIPPAGWSQTPIVGNPSCGVGLFGYSIDAPALAVDVSYTGIDFGFVSN
jgi:hypothetical protein